MNNNDIERNDILSSVDYFIEHIQRQRKIMLGVSISAIILAPFAIGLSIYLSTHSTFFLLLENENEFGLFLSILLAGIILVSVVWLVTGIMQYKTLSSWNERYRSYARKRKDLDSSLSSEYNLEE